VNVQHAISTFRGHTVPHLRIVQNKRRWLLLSGIVIVLSLGGLFLRGINYSIDFTGGSQLQYENKAGVTVQQIQELLAKAPYDRGDAEIQIVGGNQISIRTSALTDLTADERAQLVDDLARQAGVSPGDVSQQVVGPTWGRQISRQALIGLVVVLIAISLYISFRFEWKMAIGAMVAMVHDVLITAGVYALTGREVSPPTVIAILTILGFSLYDTVVIFDKVKENTESAALVTRDTYSGVVNMSLNQTLMRSVNTSLVVLLPIGSLLLFGGQTLKDFAFALFIGVASGTYSSIFVAAPLLSILKEREPRYVQIRARAQVRASRPGLRSVPGSKALSSTVSDPEVTGQPSTPTRRPPSGSGAPPRPGGKKKKGKPQGKPKRRRR
jgi:preprotein translocase subunit SecF